MKEEFSKDGKRGKRDISVKDLTEGEDFYFNKNGNFVFTEKYHLQRGYCCENKCLHCPYILK